MVFVIFLTRPGCHLCEDALPVARRAARWARQELRIVDIETDDGLIVEYGLRIPVVTTDRGVVLAEGRIQFASLLRAAMFNR